MSLRDDTYAGLSGPTFLYPITHSC